MGRPNRVTFNSVIDVCAKVGDIPQAMHTWSRMINAGVQPNEVSYNTMLKACAQGRDGEKAEQWMSKLVHDGFQPGIVSFSSLIDAFAKIGALTKAEEWFDSMGSCGLTADVVIFNSLINACAKASNPERAEYWLARVQSSGSSRWSGGAFKQTTSPSAPCSMPVRRTATFAGLKSGCSRCTVDTWLPIWSASTPCCTPVRSRETQRGQSIGFTGQWKRRSVQTTSLSTASSRLWQMLGASTVWKLGFSGWSRAIATQTRSQSQLSKFWLRRGVAKRMPLVLLVRPSTPF